MMDRFPGRYDKPRLLTLDEGLSTGWTATCSIGSSATSGGCSVGFGTPMAGGNVGGDGFINPEIIQGSV
jgi:hypothetical protein